MGAADACQLSITGALVLRRCTLGVCILMILQEFKLDVSFDVRVFFYLKQKKCPKMFEIFFFHPVPTDDSYSNEDDEGGFPPPPSPSTVEEMNKDLTLAAPQHG